MEKVIEVKNLKRVYKTKKDGAKVINTAVNDISFDIYEGEVFGLLGPNGAGKTTTIKILSTLLTPSNGTVKIFGKDVVKDFEDVRSRINFMFGGEKGVYGKLTAQEYLRYFACLYKVPSRMQDQKINELLELVKLEDKKDYKIQTFSKGMIQRIQIARSLINDPKVVFFDEPTIGLDPVIAEQIRNIIKELSKKKVTVILTTHYMKEADDLCDRIAIINNGSIKIIGSPEKIKETCRHINIFEATCKLKNGIDMIKGDFLNLEMKNLEGDYKLVRVEVNNNTNYESLKHNLSQYVDLINMQQKEITLEDAYINLISQRRTG
jgi:ABC-2 type transport system ATP-binding protein